MTGAAGLDGSILTRSLTKEGANVLGVVKPRHDPGDAERLRSYAAGIEFVECDLKDRDLPVSLVRDFEPTTGTRRPLGT